MLTQAKAPVHLGISHTCPEIGSSLSPQSKSGLPWVMGAGRLWMLPLGVSSDTGSSLCFRELMIFLGAIMSWRKVMLPYLIAVFVVKCLVLIASEQLSISEQFQRQSDFSSILFCSSFSLQNFNKYFKFNIKKLKSHFTPWISAHPQIVQPLVCLRWSLCH